MSLPVSVILPTYNRAQLLPRAVSSVLEQSFTEFELIVVDDASEDDTQAVVTAVADKRVRYVRLTHNSGVAAARNAGIAASMGQFFAFQDSDDVWHPHKLTRQMQAWQEGKKTTGSPELAVIYTQFWRQKGAHRTLFPPATSRLGKDFLDRLLWQNLVTTQAALVWGDALRAVGGFDEELPCLVDWELWLRLATQYSFYFLPEPLVTVEFTPNSVSARETAVANALAIILQKHATLFQSNQRLLAHHHYQIGHLRCMSGNKAAGMEHLETAVQLAPHLPRYRLTHLLAHLGTSHYRRIYRWKTAVFPQWF
ncbi:MAG: glycosyltransferase [Chloroflexi bacterium]|nr:glycosyltransferase [Chloroflexota bacterium]